MCALDVGHVLTSYGGCFYWWNYVPHLSSGGGICINFLLVVGHVQTLLYDILYLPMHFFLLFISCAYFPLVTLPHVCADFPTVAELGLTANSMVHTTSMQKLNSLHALSN